MLIACNITPEYEKKSQKRRLNMQKDNINPDHYKSQTSLECIEAMTITFGEQAVFDFCMCNAFKYIWRWKNKNGTEDLEKAKWYISKANELSDVEEDPLIEISDQGIVDRMGEYVDNLLNHLS